VEGHCSGPGYLPHHCLAQTARLAEFSRVFYSPSHIRPSGLKDLVGRTLHALKRQAGPLTPIHRNTFIFKVFNLY